MNKYPTKKLSEICSIRTGKKDVNYSTDDGLYPFFTCGEKIYQAPDFSFDGSAILIAGNGDVGACKKFDGKFEAYQRTYVLMDFQGIERDYLFYFLNGNLTRLVKQETFGSAIPYIKLGSLTNRKIPLPPLSTQSKIVAKLDEAFGNIDRQISLLKANIDDVERVRKSAMEESFQGEEYEMRKLGEITEIITGNTPPTKFPQYYDGKYLWAGPGDFGEFKTICTTNKTLSEKGVSEGKARLIKEGAVMLVAIGATIGKVGIAGIEMSTNQQINSFEVNEEFLNNEYLYYFFRKIKNFFLEKSSQTTLPILNKSQCKDIEIPLPSLPRQHEIVEHLDRVFAQTAELRSSYEAQIRDLETLRQSLLEEAFAGRLVSE